MPTLLLVEDDRNIHVPLRGLLEKAGYVVVSAFNGEEGLKALQRRPLPDGIVLDLMMPVMTGWDLLAEVQTDAVLRSVPVLVTTASGEYVPSAGPPILRKPYAFEVLLQSLKQLELPSPSTRAR